MKLTRLQDDRLTGGVIALRCWAWCVDLVIVGALMVLSWVMILPLGLVTLGLGFHLLWLLPAVPFLYHFLFLAGAGATPGQALLGLAVRRNDDLKAPGRLQAALSVAGLYLTFACGVLWLGVAFITTRRRALHDLLSGLVVVRKSALDREWDRPRLTGGDAPWIIRPGSPNA